MQGCHCRGQVQAEYAVALALFVALALVLLRFIETSVSLLKAGAVKTAMICGVFF